MRQVQSRLVAIGMLITTLYFIVLMRRRRQVKIDQPDEATALAGRLAAGAASS